VVITITLEEVAMADSRQIYELIELIQKIYNQGELDPFIYFIESQNRIMLYLLTHSNAHPSNISDDLNISRSNIANVLKSLESEGYIERNINSENRREIYVNLTDAGREQLKVVIEKLMGLFGLWLDLLGDESEHLIKILRISSDMSKVGEEFYRFAQSLKKEKEENNDDE